ncbi:DUF3037 domain-containing protein [Bradyrhizobium japonicum]|uniref:DUF3037 domain-containing protein n=1 Tax=Bradyrhizobium japonicum TaxID=375 RepID=UPI00057810D4|nr:DUF3037 domain-containing protein [Bradyrhizobium japonicum]
MARSFDFAVLRLAPDPLRGEAVNLGVVIFLEGGVDVRTGEILSRARAVYPAVTPDALREGVNLLKRLGAVSLSTSERHRTLSRLGVFSLGELGHFTVEDDGRDSYEAHVARLMDLYAAKPKRTAKPRPLSRLQTQIRKVFRDERVLAPVGDAGAIQEHKIVPDWPIPNRPSLKADLALRNRIMRVCEIVELKLDEGKSPTALFEGVVTLDVAHKEVAAEQTVLAYLASGPSARIDEALSIARLHATDLVNWDNPAERETFLHEWISAAHGRHLSS